MASAFLKKMAAESRARINEEYGESYNSPVNSTNATVSTTQNKASSFLQNKAASSRTGIQGTTPTLTTQATAAKKINTLLPALVQPLNKPSGSSFLPQLTTVQEPKALTMQGLREADKSQAQTNTIKTPITSPLINQLKKPLLTPATSTLKQQTLNIQGLREADKAQAATIKAPLTGFAKVKSDDYKLASAKDFTAEQKKALEQKASILPTQIQGYTQSGMADKAKAAQDELNIVQEQLRIAKI